MKIFYETDTGPAVLLDSDAHEALVRRSLRQGLHYELEAVSRTTVLENWYSKEEELMFTLIKVRV